MRRIGRDSRDPKDIKVFIILDMLMHYKCRGINKGKYIKVNKQLLIKQHI
jgi:hypothetical protein